MYYLPPLTRKNQLLHSPYLRLCQLHQPLRMILMIHGLIKMKEMILMHLKIHGRKMGSQTNTVTLLGSEDKLWKANDET
ncbi:hypothetical protein PTKIN_Ptkin18bG0061800 [Pterospermum kingtungense]